jgi:serine protease Do
MDQNQSKKRPVKGLVVRVVGVLAFVGALSLYFLMFAPDRIPKVVSNIQALGNTYSFPQASPGSAPNSDDDLRMMRSFSKVFVNIAKASRPSLVFIRVRKKAAPNMGRGMNPFGFPDEFFFPFGRPPGMDRREQPFQESAGSGFIVDLEKGYVVTNNHVIDGAESLMISTIDERQYPGKLIGGHKDSDVAVVQFEDLKSVDRSTLAQVAFGDSDKVEVGDWVVALGAPFQLPQTLTVGVVSALGRERIIGENTALEDFIQTDAAINPGNSGGPLLNIDGQVIGINTAISSMSGSSAGIGFSVPSNIARNIAERLINTGKVERGFLGIQGQDVDTLSTEVLAKLSLPPNQKGAFVYSVVDGSPADKAKLQPYDVVFEMDGQELKNFSQLRTRVAFMTPGTTIVLGVLRGGKKMTVNLVVGSSEDFKPNEEGASEARPDGVQENSKFGFALAVLTEELRKARNIAAKSGMLVTEVDERGAAARLGLRAGDLITELDRSPVTSPSQVFKAFEAAEKSGKEVLVLIERQRRSKLIVISLQ